MSCRICYEPDNLIRVCACEGTVKWVHPQCIQHWIDISKRSKCELCATPFEHPMLKKSKYMKNIFEWCLLGMGLGCIQTLLLWMVVLVAHPNAHTQTVLNLFAIIVAIFNMSFFTSALTLWIRHKKALPFILSYFMSFLFANIILQSAVNQTDLLPFYFATAGLFSVCLMIDLTLPELCVRH